MIYVQDNFLSPELFDWLSSKAISHSAKGLDLSIKNSSKEISKFYTEDKTAWDYSYKNLNNDLTIPKYKIGKYLDDIVLSIEQIVKREKNITKMPHVDSIFFMFGIVGYKVRPHIDVKKSSSNRDILSNNYKSFIFSHLNWEDDWGGELCFDSMKITPKPNRLIIYTPDEKHWVEIVNEKAKDQVRKIFGIRWGNESINDLVN